MLEYAVVGKQPVLSPRSTAKREDLPPAQIGAGTVVSTGAIVFAGTTIGERVIVGDQACIRERVTLGDDIVVGRGSLVENDTTVGAMTKIQADAYITAYSTLEEHVFIAPRVVTTNDNFMGRTERRHELMKGPTIRRGARIGGGAILCPGIEIGEEAFVGAGAVVIDGRSRRRRRRRQSCTEDPRRPGRGAPHMTAYETARLDDLRREDGWAPIRLTLDVQAFGVNAWTGRDRRRRRHPRARRGSHGPRGALRRRLRTRDLHGRGDEVDGPTGTIVFVRDPSAKRAAVAREAGTTVLTVGAKAGEAFALSRGRRTATSSRCSTAGTRRRPNASCSTRSTATTTRAPSTTTSPAPRRCSARPTRRSSTSGWHSTATRRSPRTFPRTPTSPRSATTRVSPRC